MKRILCLFGMHDYEDIGFQGIWYHHNNKANRICLNCGKKDMQKDKFISRSDRLDNILKKYGESS